jgi:hypothetical protein
MSHKTFGLPFSPKVNERDVLDGVTALTDALSIKESAGTYVAR